MGRRRFPITWRAQRAGPSSRSCHAALMSCLSPGRALPHGWALLEAEQGFATPSARLMNRHQLATAPGNKIQGLQCHSCAQDRSMSCLAWLCLPGRWDGQSPGVRESLWALSEPRTATGAANLGDWGNWWGTGGELGVPLNQLLPQPCCAY